MIITGGSGGMGRTLARRLLERGASVALLEWDGNKMEKAKEALSKPCPGGQRMGVFPCDVTDPDAVDVKIRAVARARGAPDGHTQVRAQTAEHQAPPRLPRRDRLARG